MPDWSEQLHKLQSGNSTPDENRRHWLKELHKVTNRNIIIYYSGWLEKPGLEPALTQINHKDNTGFMNVLHGLDHSKGLDLMLHTPGGEVGATEALVNYLRSIYGTNIRAFVPDLAMSGGTVIACACKEIFMGKHSNLSPIDPQMVIHQIKRVVPAHATIEEFELAHKEIKKDQSKLFSWQPILNKYPPGFLVQCRKSIELQTEMVTDFLSTGMFKDEDNPVEKSREVVKQLTNYKMLKSHARPLPPDRCSEFGLKIQRLEDDEDLRDAVLSVHHACILTLSGTQAYKIIENHTGKAYIPVIVNQQVNIPLQGNVPQPQKPQTKNTQKNRPKRPGGKR